MQKEYHGPLLGVREDGEAITLAVWWWDLDLLARPDAGTGLTAQEALDTQDARSRNQAEKSRLTALRESFVPWRTLDLPLETGGEASRRRDRRCSNRLPHSSAAVRRPACG